MNLDNIPAGKNPPSDVNVVIEITGGANGGQPVKYGRVKAGGRYEQQTYAGHVWLLVDGEGNPVRLFTATADPGRAVIEDEQP